MHVRPVCLLRGLFLSPRDSWLSVRVRILPVSRHSPSLLERDPNRPCMSARVAIDRTMDGVRLAKGRCMRVASTYSCKVNRSVSVMDVHQEEDDSALTSPSRRSRMVLYLERCLLANILEYSGIEIQRSVCSTMQIWMFTLTCIFSPTYNHYGSFNTSMIGTTHIYDLDKRPLSLFYSLIKLFVIIDTPIIVLHSGIWIPSSILCHPSILESPSRSNTHNAHREKIS